MTSQKSSTLWIFLALAALVLVGGVLGLIFFLSQPSTPSRQQTSTGPAQRSEAPGTSPAPDLPPARAATTRKTDKATPADTDNLEDPEGDSAFERAESLKEKNAREDAEADKSEDGSDMRSESSAKPSPSDND